MNRGRVARAAANRARWGAPCAAAALLLLPNGASAHLAATGLGPVYDGAWHLLRTPSQVATLAAAALFAGRSGAAAARRSFLIAPVLWLVAWVCVSVSPRAAALTGAVAMLAAGLLVSSDLRLGPWARAVAVAAIAVAAGVSYDGSALALNALGGFAALLMVTALLASVAIPLRRASAILALRVAGSWTAALGLLLIGWWIHGRSA